MTNNADLQTAFARPVSAYKAALFDCDGLLLDTGSAWHEAFRAGAETLGLSLGEPEYLSLVGASVRSGADLLLDWSRAQVKKRPLRQEITTALLAAIDASPPPILPGVIDLLQSLHGHIPLAVASNAPEIVLTHVLRATGLDQYFDTVLSASTVAQPKPAPDLYLHAAASVGAPPAACIAFEDSSAGAEAARAAGIDLVIVSTLPRTHFDSLLARNRTSQIAIIPTLERFSSSTIPVAAGLDEQTAAPSLDFSNNQK